MTASRPVPTLTAVMPVYNTAPFVEEAVRSVLAQSFSDFELLVVDDGSTDGSAEIVEAIGDPRIRIVRTPHAGLAGAENAGLREARGRYLARVDSDDIVLPELFEKLVVVMDANPGTAAVGAWTRRFGARQAFDRPPTDPKVIRRALRRWWVLSQPVVYRTDDVREAGGFRDMQSEDWDLWIRLAKRHEVRVVPECLGLIRTRPASMTMSISRRASRADKLRMRLIGLRHLGADPLSLIVLGKSVGVWMLYAALDRVLPPKRVRPEPARDRPTVSVVVLESGDPARLDRCLEGVEAQDPRPDEVVVLSPMRDRAMRRLLGAWERRDPGRRRLVALDGSEAVPALRQGTAAARSDVVAFLEDDAVPEPGWLEELGRGFLDPAVGAVGGPVGGGLGDEHRGGVHHLGHVSWFGRTVWGHASPSDHYGPVSFLSGANMAIRRSVAEFDPRLLHDADGRALGSDVDVCLAVWRAGYRVLFTPWARVDELPGQAAFASDGGADSGSVVAAAANRTYAVLKHVSAPRRLATLVSGYVVGTSAAPGPVRVLAELVRHPRAAVRMAGRIIPAWRGRRIGRRMYREHRRDVVIPLPRPTEDSLHSTRAS
jgi:cellulose synthase/poly-beta-1,6-N-acetylglucosamine synthase-like glycosyltransferase